MTPPSTTYAGPGSLSSIDPSTIHSEQLFGAIFEQAAVGVALVETATGRFVRINQRYCEIVGLSLAEMMATTFMAITHPDDRQADSDRMEEMIAGRIRAFTREKRYVRPDGSTVWINLTVSPIWDRGQEPNFHIAVVQDITERKQAEETLRATEVRLAAVLENSPSVVFIKDREGRYLLVNQAFERQFGLTAGQIIGRTDTDIFPAGQAVMFQTNDREVIQSGTPMQFEEVARYADGEHISIVVKFPLRTADDDIYAICGIATDITGRKQAERALADLNATLEQQIVQRTHELEESRQQLRAIVEGTSDAVFLKDVQGRYLLCNEATGRFVGMPPHKVPGNDDTALFPLEEAKRLMEQDRRTMAGNVTETHEEEITTADGVLRTFLSTKGPLFDGQGRVVGLFGISRDITDRTRAERALRESEERFRNIFEHAAMGIVIATLEGRLLRCNPAYCLLLGYTESELRELDFKELVHPDDLAANLAQKNRLYAGEVPSFEVENRYRRKDGCEVWVHKYVSFLRDQTGRPMNVIVLVTDITERRRAQELLEQRVAERTAEVRERETELARLIAHFPGVVSRVDPDLRYRYASPKYRDWFGKDPQEVVGRHVAEIIGREAFARARPALERALAGERITFENFWKGLGEEIQHGLVTFEPEFNREGACTGVAVYVVNISARKQAEEALRASEQFNREVLDALSDHVAVLDKAGTIIAVNRSWERFAARNNPEGSSGLGVGTNYLVVCRKAASRTGDLERVIDGIDGVLSDRTPMFMTEYLCEWPGGRKWYLMRVTRLRTRAGGCVVSHEDITARKQAEEALESAYCRLQDLGRELQMVEERERSRLSRELHDEFGQLLSALKFDLVRIATGLERLPRSAAGSLKKAARNAATTVDGLFSSLRVMVRGLRPAVLEELGLVSALQALASETQGHFKLRCSVNAASEGLPSSFGLAVEGAIYRVAQALLTNVVRHAKATDVTVSLGAADGIVRLTVEDNGVGFQVSKAQEGRFGLRGIQERVELLGGSVSIQSGPGKGTTVSVTIPLESAPITSSGGSPRGPATSTVGDKRRRHDTTD